MAMTDVFKEAFRQVMDGSYPPPPPYVARRDRVELAKRVYPNDPSIALNNPRKAAAPSRMVGVKRWMKYIARNQSFALHKHVRIGAEHDDRRYAKRLILKQVIEPAKDAREYEHRVEMVTRRANQLARISHDMQARVGEINRRRKLAGLADLPWRKSLQMIMLTRGKYNGAALSKAGHR